MKNLHFHLEISQAWKLSQQMTLFRWTLFSIFPPFNFFFFLHWYITLSFLSNNICFWWWLKINIDVGKLENIKIYVINIQDVFSVFYSLTNFVISSMISQFKLNFIKMLKYNQDKKCSYKNNGNTIKVI